MAGVPIRILRADAFHLKERVPRIVVGGIDQAFRTAKAAGCAIPFIDPACRGTSGAESVGVAEFMAVLDPFARGYLDLVFIA